MKLKVLHRILIILVSITLFLPVNIDAKTNNNTYSFFQVLEKGDTTTLDTCEGILGNIDDEDDVAWLLQKALNYIKIIGPSLAIVLSSVDFLKAVVASDDESMKKTQMRFKNRMIAAVLLFFIPFLVSFIMQLTGLMVSDASCGLS